MGSLGAEIVPWQTAVDRPYLLVLSAYDEDTLLHACEELCENLIECDDEVSRTARSLLTRKTHDVHRAFAVTKYTDVTSDDFVMDCVRDASPSKIILLFTGQGSQWPQMGKDLLSTFPVARAVIAELDAALHEVADPPSWSLAAELAAPRSKEHYGRPEIAQTLTTAVQLAIVAIYEDWGIQFESVIGHSSGEIAAACVAGLLSRREAILTAYYCGWAADDFNKKSKSHAGMLAVGAPVDVVEQLLEGSKPGEVRIACYNGPRALTLSGPSTSLEKLKQALVEQGRQTSLLNCPVAYHHPEMMENIGNIYECKLEGVISTTKQSGRVLFISTITTEPMTKGTDATYWKNNITLPIQFEETLTRVLCDTTAPITLVEIGPAGSLAGAVLDIKTKMGPKGAKMSYYKSMNRGKSSITPMFHLAGILYATGYNINLARVNT